MGNLTWKGNIYSIPNMGDYKAYDVAVNLIKYSTRNNKIFKENFTSYAREVENDKRTFNNLGYVDKAVEILGNELNNNKRAMAIAMEHIIDKNPNVYAEFKKIYENQYVDYLKK